MIPPARLPALLAFAFLALFAPLGMRAADFAQSESDLRANPDARFGDLPNGVSYVVLSNHSPEDRASFRLIVRAGSFNETDDQQGLAHFVAHMAFRGSAHYPAGSMIETLKKWGMSADPEDDAITDFDHTTYLLELPDTRASTLKEGFRIFTDVAGGVSFKPEQIEAERAPILTEKLQRASAAYKDQIAEMRFTLPGTIIPRRLPIGLGDVIEHAGRDRLAAFYDAWYRPERITVVAVGDFDANDIEQMIRDAFGDLRDRAPAQPEPNLGDIPIVSGLQAKYLAEPGAATTRISIETIRPCFHEADTVEKRLENLERGLAFGMLNRRLAELARKDGAPFLSASSDVGELFDFVHNASLQIICKPDRWREALASGEQELRRALQYGFQPAELKGVAEGLRKSFEQSSLAAGSRPSDRIADGIARCIVRRQVFTSPTADLSVYGTALDHITADQCGAALQQAWAAKGTYLVVTGDLALPRPEQDIAAAYARSAAVAVDAPARIVEEDFPYASFGTPGTIVSRSEVADLGVTEVVFANGVRLNLKPTKFEPGKIDVSVRIGGGSLSEPANAEPGLGRFTEGVFTAAGLGRIGAADVRRILEGKSLGIDFRVLDDAFSFTGATDRLDLELELQLIAAYITDPGYRPEAQERARRAIPQMYRALDRAPDGVLETRIARLMANGDPRFGIPAQSDLAVRNLDEVRAWLAPQLGHGPIEVALVGDLDVATAIQAVAQTLGALPARDAKPAYVAERSVATPVKPIAPQIIPAGPGVTRSAVIIVWPTTDGREVRVAHRLGLLASIFSARLREKLQDPASGAPPPVARSFPSTTYAGYGTFTVDIIADATGGDAAAGRQKALSATRAALAIAADLSRNGVTEAEFEHAKQSALQAISDTTPTNDYWLSSVLADAQEEPQRLEWARHRLDDMNSITRNEITELAAVFLDPVRASRFLVTPR